MRLIIIVISTLTTLIVSWWVFEDQNPAILFNICLWYFVSIVGNYEFLKRKEDIELDLMKKVCYVWSLPSLIFIILSLMFSKYIIIFSESEWVNDKLIFVLITNFCLVSLVIGKIVLRIFSREKNGK